MKNHLKTLCHVLLFLLLATFSNTAFTQEESNQKQLDYLNVELEKANLLFRTGKAFYTGGIFGVAVGALAAFSSDSPEVGGVFAAAGAISWVAGAFIMGGAKSKIQYLERRKLQLSFCIKPSYYEFPLHEQNTASLSLSLKIKI